MKSLPVLGLLLFTLLLAACDSKDAQLRRALVGTWQSTATNDQGVSDYGECTYFDNGEFHAKGTLYFPDHTTRDFKGAGTWTIQKEQMQWKLAESNIPDLIPVGFASSDKIVHITEQEYQYVDSDTGKTMTEYRVK